MIGKCTTCLGCGQCELDDPESADFFPGTDECDNYIYEGE